MLVSVTIGSVVVGIPSADTAKATEPVLVITMKGGDSGSLPLLFEVTMTDEDYQYPSEWLIFTGENENS